MIVNLLNKEVSRDPAIPSVIKNMDCSNEVKFYQRELLSNDHK